MGSRNSSDKQMNDALTAPLQLRFLPDRQHSVASSDAATLGPADAEMSSQPKLFNLLVLFALGVFTGGIGWLLHHELGSFASRNLEKGVNQSLDLGLRELAGKTTVPEVMPASFSQRSETAFIQASSTAALRSEPPPLLPTPRSSLLDRVMQQDPLGNQAAVGSSN